ncbi:MAG: hypothetical protein ABEH66_05635 [Halobacteriales archaeon]
MPEPPPEEVSVEALRELTLSDLVAMRDEEGIDHVESLLCRGLEAAGEFLADHGKRLTDLPAVVYDPMESGVAYDPYHDQGEVLVIGGPRGLLRGGEQVLGRHGLLDQKALLSILCKGLLHSYNQELSTAHFERGGRAGRSRAQEIELYDRFQMLDPAIDEGVTQIFVLYLNGDVTDDDLRDTYIEEWVEWYERDPEFDTGLFEAVARTIGDRIDEAEGDERDRLVQGLAIQEPLIRDGDVSVLRGRLAEYTS